MESVPLEPLAAAAVFALIAVLAVVLILIVLVVLILALVLAAVLILVLVVILVAVLITVLVIHSKYLHSFTYGPAATVACPDFQDLSLVLKRRLARSPAATAAVIPPAQAVRPPVKIPMKPSLAMASLTPLARL